jgi:hypothetical protein
VRPTIPLLALVLSAGTSTVAAQVTSLRGLSFGTITSGTTTAVAKTSASAAQWRINGTFLLGGTFTLTLPSVLNGPGTAIPISFSATDGQRNTVNNPSGGSAFNPANTQNIPALGMSGWARPSPHRSIRPRAPIRPRS